MVPEISKYGGHVIQSSLSNEQETALQEALDRRGARRSAETGSPGSATPPCSSSSAASRLLTDPVLRAARRAPAPPRRRAGAAPPARRRAGLAPALRPPRPALAARCSARRPPVVAPRGAGGCLRRRGFAASRGRAGRRVDVGGVRGRARRRPSTTAPPAARRARPTPLGFVVERRAARLLRRRHRPVRRAWPTMAPVDVALLPGRGLGPDARARPPRPRARRAGAPRCCARAWPCRSTGARCIRVGLAPAPRRPRASRRTRSRRRWRSSRPRSRCACSRPGDSLEL